MTSKRIVDIAGAACALIVLSPLFLVIAIAIRLSMGGPVLFRQERAGLDGVTFEIRKFRSMSDAPSGVMDVSLDYERITRLGAFLRRSSLDELPEFLNVLEGSMSLVGPRPLFVDYLDLYTPKQARRVSVRPGLTGWAQINGRNAVTWEQKFDMDVWYVDNRSLTLDLKILLRTVRAVLAREGISAEGTETAHRFTGS